ncbi:phosphoribosylformylglycinamidine synthase [Lasius niger]|uniref:Phosphoribosylformylglycinamidine synthase n=1 Tax=Lasius niger TaxID=67767 RepID=A0A0J7N6C5_LASNI|nr:phosphoribosylformylglycinamidine synthase [Lasius niger]
MGIASPKDELMDHSLSSRWLLAELHHDRDAILLFALASIAKERCSPLLTRLTCPPESDQFDPTIWGVTAGYGDTPDANVSKNPGAFAVPIAIYPVDSWVRWLSQD